MTKVRELMTTDVPLTTPNTPAIDAARLMMSAGIDCLLVFDMLRPVAIVTEKDFVRKVVSEGRSPFQVHVGDIMSSPLVTIDPDRSIKDAALLMVEKKIRRLAVVKDGTLVGILRADDFTKHFSKKSIQDEILESMAKNDDNAHILMSTGSQ